MALFLNSSEVIICASDKFLVYNTINESCQKICIPEINIPPNLTKNQQESLKNEKCVIISCNFSENSEYFAVTTSNKQLVVYDKQYNVIKNLNVNRAASKLHFTSTGDILIADKTGDVYLYKLSENSEPVQILGHLSMVLDVLTTKNDKYIITCDRDEKIRVSHFPNGYNIVSYCLGHEEFVLSLELYSSDILISASGDGTLRFWNFLIGKQLCIVNINDFVKDKNLVTKFAEQMDNETVEISNLPIVQMKIKHMNDFVLIVCTLYSYNSLLVLKVTGEVNVNLLQIIELNNNIVSFDLKDSLYILCDKIYCYNFCNDLFVEAKSKINNFYEDVEFKNFNLTENISVLYKRKYDNVQEYQERKKLRIENKNK